MADNIIYIPYGLDEISQSELLTALANDLPNFINRYKWLLKPKNRDTFLKIYSDMVKGLTGASNDNGLWNINTSSDMDSYLASPKEKVMAEHAAYYIQLQMAKMAPRKKEEEKKEDKKSYGNKEFLSGITQYVGLDRFGGQESLRWAQDWLNLDSNTNGIYSTTKRLSELAKYLGLYRDKIKSELDKYDFTTGPYGSYDEFNSRIERAIAALNNPEWNQEDIDSLNRLGLDREAWLATGANTPITITDANGNLRTITREEYNKLQEEQKLQEEKKKQEEENKKKLTLNLNIRNNINRYRGIFTYTPNLNTFGIESFRNAQNVEDIVAHVRNNFAKITSNDEFRKRSNEISGAYKILGENKKLKPISNEIWNILNRSKKFSEDKGRGLDKSKFMQLEGIDNIVFDSESRKVYYLDKEVPVKKMLDTVLKYRLALKEAQRNNYYSGELPNGRLIFFKHGGSIKNLDKIIEDFIKNNNI